jgi:hypothetical protein
MWCSELVLIIFLFINRKHTMNSQGFWNLRRENISLIFLVRCWKFFFINYILQNNEALAVTLKGSHMMSSGWIWFKISAPHHLMKTFRQVITFSQIHLDGQWL